MSIVQEKMYMDVDDVCAILCVSKAYAYNLMREYNKELKAKGYIVVAGKIEYSRAMKSHFRKFGNQMSGSGNHLCNYASLLA